MNEGYDLLFENFWMMVLCEQRDKRGPNETLEEQIARVLGHAGPSMLLTSISESVTFFLGRFKLYSLPFVSKCLKGFVYFNH